MNFEKEILNQIILVNLIRQFFCTLNGILTRNKNKLKYNKMCRIIYANWCQEIYGISIRMSQGKNQTS